MRRLLDAVLRPRQFELWEAPAEGQPFFMIASGLTRREAVGTASAHALTAPRSRVLVLDGQGNPVYR